MTYAIIVSAHPFCSRKSALNAFVRHYIDVASRYNWGLQLKHNHIIDIALSMRLRCIAIGKSIRGSSDRESFGLLLASPLTFPDGLSCLSFLSLCTRIQVLNLYMDKNSRNSSMNRPMFCFLSLSGCSYLGIIGVKKMSFAHR